VMNYRWYKMARGAIARRPPLVEPGDFGPYWDSLQQGFDRYFGLAMMNVSSSHDSPRLSTSLANDFPYKAGQGPRGNPDYRADKPGEDTWLRRQLPLLAQQFTWIGAPQIYYGEEIGMWGADDPDCRKPMLWPENGSRVEYTHPDGLEQEPDTIDWKDSHVRQRYEAYQQLIDLRKSNPTFIYGDVDYPDAYNDKLLVYTRYDEQETFLCLFNPSHEIVEEPLIYGYDFVLSSNEFDERQMNGQLSSSGTTYLFEPGDFLILQKSN
ncbi:MAG: alpha-amylase family glycosyl hydrolase, partial [Bacteroidota bacterium]